MTAKPRRRVNSVRTQAAAAGAASIPAGAMTESASGLARSYATRAIETLVAVMTDGAATPAARVAAAKEILDRGFGRPAAENAADGAVHLRVGKLIWGGD